MTKRGVKRGREGTWIERGMVEGMEEKVGDGGMVYGGIRRDGGESGMGRRVG